MASYLDSGYDNLMRYRGSSTQGSLSGLTDSGGGIGSVLLGTTSSNMLSNSILDSVSSVDLRGGDLIDALVLQKEAFIRGGATSYFEGSGVFLGWHETTHKFFIGDSDGDYLTWDGSTLSISGTVAVIAGSIAGLTITATALTATAGGNTTIISSGATAFTAGPTGVPTFTVTQAGALVATSATITGVVTANTGYIGGTTGWVIASETLKDAAGVVGMSSAVTGGDDIRFWAGDAVPASAEFRVYESGALVASSATITGSVTATSGAIGGWTINATSITDTAGVVGMSSAVTGGDDIRFWAGDVTPGSAEFRVTEAGALVASSATITGSITATSGDIGGWVIIAGYIYNLQAGTPTAAPSDGVVFASGNEGIIIYEDTEKRIELGYLSADVYGLKGYATDGVTILFELSDSQVFIAGWTISSTTLANSTNIILDASNKAISINDATFGNDGIQLQYNAGNSRAYIGDGANEFFKFDGTNISWNSPNSSLSTAGKLTTISAAIGGWEVVTGYIYNLQSGTPTVAPNDGVVLASGNEGLIIYEDTEKRAEFGYLSAGVYGLKIYATNGSDVIFEASDTQQKVGGWNFTNTVLRSGATDAASNVLIDSANSLLRLGPTTGDYITMDGANKRIRSSDYVSGAAGAGFTLEPDLLEVGNIAARGLIRTAVFQKDIVSAVSGSVLITPNSDVLDVDMTAAD